MPTSKEINEAVSLLTKAGVDKTILNDLHLWNTRRLRLASNNVTSRNDVMNLFAGLDPEVFADAGIIT